MFSVHIDIWKAEIRKHKELFFCRLRCMRQLKVSSTKILQSGSEDIHGSTPTPGVGVVRRDPESTSCQMFDQNQRHSVSLLDREIGEVAHVTSTVT